MNDTSRHPMAVITGASTGIGYALACEFAERGYSLIVCAEDEAIHLAARRLQEAGARVQAVQADLSTYEGCEHLYEESIRASGGIVDALALNAGVGTSGKFATETDLRRELEIIHLNVVGTVHLAKRFVKDMVAQRQGRILITASVAGTMPAPLMAVYGATKAFDLSFAASLRHELRDTGVSVTALTPGPTDTEFFARAGMENTKVANDDAKANDPADVARQAFEALMAGKDRIIGASSLGTKLQGAAARFMPEKVKAKMHERMAEPVKREH